MPTLVLRIPLPTDGSDPAPVVMEALAYAMSYLRSHDLREWPEFVMNNRAGERSVMAKVEE